MGEDGLAPKENLWVNLEYDKSALLLIAEETNLAPAEPVVVTRGTDTWELGTNHRLEITLELSTTCSLEIQDAAGETLETPGSGPCNVDITWDGWVEKPSRRSTSTAATTRTGIRFRRRTGRVSTPVATFTCGWVLVAWISRSKSISTTTCSGFRRCPTTGDSSQRGA